MIFTRNAAGEPIIDTSAPLTLTETVLRRAVLQHLGKPPDQDELNEARDRVGRLRADLERAEMALRAIESRAH